LEEQALADGCYGLALGLTLHLAQTPPVSGSQVVTNVLTQQLADITGGRLMIEPDAEKAAAGMIEIINEKRQGLGLSVAGAETETAEMATA
jgi:carbon-monoxide dehydrogenase catalytic subunit